MLWSLTIRFDYSGTQTAMTTATKKDNSKIYGIIGVCSVVGSILLAMSAKLTSAPTVVTQLAALLFVMGCLLWGDYQQARRIAALEDRVRELENRQSQS